jgi:ribosomal protein S18 acetylase RimI-like enzyme
MVDIAEAVREAETVRRATEPELPALASVLARAFYDDPQFVWLIPDASRRMAMLERGFGLFARKLWFPQDECYVTGSGVGAAVWLRPGEWEISVWRQIAMGPAMFSIFRRYLPRIGAALARMESNHPHERHWYLAFIGVDPEWQGRGIGAALMRPVLERCDGDGLPAYLEASNPRNRALYERHGFEVTEEFKIGKGSPPLWRMWRAPAA